MVKDVGLLDKLIGIQIPMNVSEASTATQPIAKETLGKLQEYMNAPATSSMTVCL